jgi:hypothetical protein
LLFYYGEMQYIMVYKKKQEDEPNVSSTHML